MSITESTQPAQPPRQFTYLPTPPRAPAQPGCSYQRWFPGDDGSPYVGQLVEVYRDASRNAAEVRIAYHGANHSVQADAALSAADLRELAARLLRAADDIEAHPAPVHPQPPTLLNHGLVEGDEA